MNPNYTHDFSSASIKHLIEAEFYRKVGEILPKQRSATIVTGPDFKRHIDNYRKFISSGKLRICEINLDIFIDIYRACKSIPEISVVNKSIELFGSTFIDCDLTCVSDLDVIKNTLLKQIETQCQVSNHNKAFIFSFALRTSNPKSITAYLRPILGLLGSTVSDLIVSPINAINSYNWIKRVKIYGTKSRLKECICYEYNAGGGPMLTCLLIYK